MLRILLLVALLLGAGGLRAQDSLVPAAEALNPPTPARLDALAAAGRSTGWQIVSATAREAAYAAYARDRTLAAEAWHHVDRWATLFAEHERNYVRRFAAAVNASKASRAAMRFEPQDRALGGYLPAELQRWLLGNAAFSTEFFSLLSDLDYLPRVFGTLASIRQADPVRFAEYPGLVIALALVQDVPPPEDWPHRQVAASALPRRWPDPVAAFNWWVREDRAGRTYQRLNRLGADELKFVVDTPAPFSQLEWAQRAVPLALADLPQAYTLIKYRVDRVENRLPDWPLPSYDLSTILQNGGICVDQAYFAATVGKARGVPTIVFRGEGLDGRHAWFGFLDASQRWQLDAGRYAEQRFITGLAFDPQTWTTLSDHELQFLSLRFRLLPAFQQSRVHTSMAAQLLRDGRQAESVAAARKAVNYERRNLAAWDALLRAQEAAGTAPAAIEATLSEAKLAFESVPDLEIGFSNRLAASLRARGETSRADFEQRTVALKYQARRGDLTIQQAADLLQRALANPSLPERVRTYNFAVDNYGRGAGIEFFDKVVVVFAEHLLIAGQPQEAQRAIDRARAALKIEPGKQLEQEMNALAERVRTGRLVSRLK